MAGLGRFPQNLAHSCLTSSVLLDDARQVILYERKGLGGRSKAPTKKEYELDDPELSGE